MSFLLFLMQELFYSKFMTDLSDCLIVLVQLWLSILEVSSNEVIFSLLLLLYFHLSCVYILFLCLGFLGFIGGCGPQDYELPSWIALVSP